MAIVSFVINETVVPVMTKQSKDLALWSFSQKNVPDGKHNFTFEEVADNGGLKRLFYVEFCENKKLHNITLLDMSKDDTIHVLQAKEGGTSPDGWLFNNGIVYTIADKGKVLNSTFFVTKGIEPDKKRSLQINLYDKIALPLTTIVLVLIGIPLAITPPRVRYNRGFLFSILIIFAYYLIRALSISFGEAGTLPALIAAFLPNIVLTISGIALYYRKVFTIT